MTEGVGAFSGVDWDAERATLSRHFIRDMEGLWTQVLKQAAIVEESLNVSVRALCERRADLAKGVKSDEEIVNSSEVAIERECLKVLALHQPVASDLRRVAVVLRVNSDLERMADLAQHIAKRARKLAKSQSEGEVPERLEALAIATLAQVRDSLDSLARHDATLARKVMRGDHAIDRQRRLIQAELKESIRKDPDRLDNWLRLINTSRNLERIADHATNIAESVIYLKEGEIVRHSRDEGGRRRSDPVD
jgi:phosphate transport system protein